MSRTIDRIIGLFKWPMAAVAFVLLPLSVIASLKLALRIIDQPTPMISFAFGFAIYALLWQIILRRRVLGTFFSTLEHELTHALFAVATLHRVTELRSSFTQGGHMRYVGRGNWLITISPYFFPTVCFAIILATAVVPDAWRWWADALLGAATAYHFISTTYEAHAGQTDLQRAGFLFSFLFLPAANIVSFGLVVAFCHARLPGMGRFLTDLAPPYFG